MKPKRLFVIDAMAMAFRSFHAFSVRPLSTSSGIPTSAVYGSAIFLLKLIDDEKPDYLVFATDTGHPTFRHELYEKYKANRTAMPEDLSRQIPYLYRLFEALGAKLLRQPGVEADDLIGSLVTQNASPDLKCFIVSGDKDFLQLVTDDIYLYAPKKAEAAQIIGSAGVLERFNCRPENVIDALALIGDTADNVPGVNGIGEKGAAKLIGTYGSLDGIYEHLADIKNERQREALIQGKEQAYLARELLKIKCDLKLEHPLSEFTCDVRRAGANPTLLKLFNELEFRGLSQRIAADLKDLEDAAPHPAGGFKFPTLPLVSAGPAPTTPQLAQGAPRAGYELANDPARINRALAAMARVDVFSFDTETTGLHVVTDRPIGLSLSAEEGKGFYIPFVAKHLQGISPDEVLALVRPLLADPHKTKVAHNAKFDCQMLANLDVPVALPMVDTMICSWLLDSVSREHGLDACAMRALGIKKIPTSALIGAHAAPSMLEVDLSVLADYAAEDADVTLRLYHHFLPQIEANHLTSVLHTIDMPLVPILARMERQGVFVDAEALDEISNKLFLRMKELEKQIYDIADEEFNIHSTKQLQRILFEKLKVHEALGVKRIKKTKTGFSTDVTVLESLSEHPLPFTLLEFRILTKLKNTYVDALPQLICPETSRLHTSFHQCGTATGRLSSSDPNLQNIPIRTEQGREIRKAFRPAEPDWVIVSADYSQVELRLLAHIAKEEALAEAFRQGEDIHTATAAKIFGLPSKDVDATLRSRAKAINFGIIYGMGPQRLARETGVTMSEAKTFIEKYFEGYPMIRRYIEEAVSIARRCGYTTTITGRRRPVPEFNSNERMMVVNAENIAVNSPIQGSAADLIKIAMIAIQKQLDQLRSPARMLMQVHDELVFECPRDDAEGVKALVRESMEGAMRLDVPLVVEVGIGANWLEAH